MKSAVYYLYENNGGKGVSGSRFQLNIMKKDVFIKNQKKSSANTILKGSFFLLAAVFFLIFGCSHFNSIYAPVNYSLDDLKIDTFEAKFEVLNGYKGYAGKVIKVSPINGINWGDYSRSVYWDWELDYEGYQQIIVTMSVLAESPNSGRPQTSAYRPQGGSAGPSNIKWNGPANIGWTVQNGEESYEQFGGKAVEVPLGQWVDLRFSETVDLSHASEGQIYIDGHNDNQGLLDMILYIRNFTVTMRPTSRFVALTFDDSPSDFTDFLLDKLDDYDVTATFFVTGMGIEAMHPLQDRNLTASDRLITAPERKEAIMRMLEDGHEIGNLYYYYRSTESGTAPTEAELRKEIEDTQITIQKAAYGENDYMDFPLISRYLRIPDNLDSQTVNILKKIAAEMGLPVISGSFAGEFDSLTSAEDIANTILNGIDSWGISINKDPRSDPAILRVLDVLIPRLKSEGYVFVTLSEMEELRRTPLVPGNIYTSMDPDLP